MCVSVCVVSYSQMSSAIFTHTHTPACQNKAEAVTKLQLRLKKNQNKWNCPESVLSGEMNFVNNSSIYSPEEPGTGGTSFIFSVSGAMEWEDVSENNQEKSAGQKKNQKKKPNNNRSGKYYTVNLNNWWGKFENSKRGHSERQALSTGSPLW